MIVCVDIFPLYTPPLRQKFPEGSSSCVAFLLDESGHTIRALRKLSVGSHFEE